MERLQRYNQKLLAILGTLALVALIVFLLSMGVMLAMELRSLFPNNNVHDNALVVNTDSIKTEDGNTQIVRKQELTMGTPRLIDTLKAIYLIPVSQVNLKDPEYVKGNKVQGLLESSSNKRYWSYSGYFNNVILYNQIGQTKRAVFQKKVLISQFEHREINGKLYLFITGSTQDHNQNGKLDGDDLKDFYLYNVSQDQIHQYSMNGFGLSDYYVPYNSNEILLRYTKDKDKDGNIDEYREPTIIKKLNLETMQLEDLIDLSMVKELQQLID